MQTLKQKIEARIEENNSNILWLQKVNEELSSLLTEESTEVEEPRQVKKTGKKSSKRGKRVNIQEVILETLKSEGAMPSEQLIIDLDGKAEKGNIMRALNRLVEKNKLSLHKGLYSAAENGGGQKPTKKGKESIMATADDMRAF